MAENIVELLTDVADAIREKKGSNEPINAQNFANEIKNLPSGGDIDALVARTITEYENDTLDAIASYVFAYCSSLKRVVITNVRTIGTLTFAHCTAITEFVAPSLEDAGEQSLRNLSNMEQIDLPSLKNIKSYVFHTNNKMHTLILRGNHICSLVNVNAFGGTPIANGTGYIYVPDDLVDAYKGATNWSTYASQIKGLSELPNE